MSHADDVTIEEVVFDHSANRIEFWSGRVCESIGLSEARTNAQRLGELLERAQRDRAATLTIRVYTRGEPNKDRGFWPWNETDDRYDTI